MEAKEEGKLQWELAYFFNTLHIIREMWKLYSLQMNMLKEPEENIKYVVEITENIKEKGLLVLPELWFCGYDYKNIKYHAHTSVEVVEEMMKISEKRNIILCFTVPWYEGDGLYNRAFLIEKGRIVGTKDKMKLFPLLEEHCIFIAGSKNPVFETEMGRIGILVCFELRFTELVNDLKDKQIDILLVPSQWGLARKEHLYILSRARALELQCYVVVSNTWGKFLSVDYAGMSGIYSPWGEIVAFSEKGNNLLKSEFDRREIEKIRRFLPVYSS